MIIMVFVKQKGGGGKYIGNGRTALSYQLSYFLSPARQCGKVVALRQVFVYKIMYFEFLDRTRQIIRYRATATLGRPQNKQYSASK